MTRIRRHAALALAALAVACAPVGRPDPAGPGGIAAGTPVGRPVSSETLPGWAEDRVSAALPAVRAACAALPRSSASGAAMAAACDAAALLPEGDDAAMRDWLGRYFVAEERGAGTATGYYEPILRASPSRAPGLTAPLLAMRPGGSGTGGSGTGGLGPAGLSMSRAAITAAVERGRPPAPVLAWADPVDAFFLEIQGSGRVVFPDGTVRRVGYAGANGQRYVAIGRVLVDRGIMTLEEVSMVSLRAWLRDAGPGGARELMERNPAQVFFRWRDDLSPGEGPVGSLGAPLVAGRNVAVDRSSVPLGVPVWIATRHPLTGEPLRRLVVAADTGGAIRGAARVDLFWGSEGEAEAASGRMREEVQVWAFRPR